MKVCGICKRPMAILVEVDYKPIWVCTSCDFPASSGLRKAVESKQDEKRKGE